MDVALEFLNPLVLDKAYAWAASKHYAELDKYELAQMPELLTKAMKK